MSTNNSAVANRMSNFKSLIESYKGEIEKALPRVGLTAERMIRMVLTAARITPRLQECTQSSIVKSMIQASQLGLEPDGVLGKAYLIPYKTECTLQLGYQGLLELARRSGDIKRVRVETVRQGDKLRVKKGLVEELVHTPQDDDLAPAIGYYAIVEMVSGGIQWDYWSVARVEKHRQRYVKATGKDSPWEGNFDAMAMKTVLKHVLKLCPRTTEMDHAIRVETEQDDVETALPVAVTDLTPMTGPWALGSDAQTPTEALESPIDPVFELKRQAALQTIANLGKVTKVSLPGLPDVECKEMPPGDFMKLKTPAPPHDSSGRKELERDFWAKWNSYSYADKDMAMERLGVKVVTSDVSSFSDDLLMALLNEGYRASEHYHE